MSSGQVQVDAPVRKWDEVLEYLEAGGDKTYGFLQLAESDLGAFSHTVVCTYCRKQMEAEVKLIGITLQFSKLANEWAGSTAVSNRMRIIGRAIPVIARLTYLELLKSV